MVGLREACREHRFRARLNSLLYPYTLPSPFAMASRMLARQLKAPARTVRTHL